MKSYLKQCMCPIPSLGLRHFCLALMLFLGVLMAYSQHDSTTVADTAKYYGDFKIDVQMNGSGGTNSAVRPMWSYSQEWGRYTQYNQWEGSVYTKVLYHWHNRKNWFSINVGLGLQASTDSDRIMLHEAYVSGKIWEIGYTLGREAYTPLDQRDNLGVGTYLMSNNARPTTRFGFGFMDYWAIPGIKNWIELKAAFYVGMMPNENNSKYTKNVVLHEKFAYLRIGHFPVKPYVGLVHSVMMGGTLASGKEIPIDFWASFFGKGSTKLLEAGYAGEYYNAAGGHQGMWDLGFDFDFDVLSASLYYQRPFYDGTAINLFNFKNCKDFTIGANVRFKKFKPITSVCVEWFNMLWQGGNGPADPIFVSTGPEKTGEVVGCAQNNLTAEFIRKYVSADWISEWESKNGQLTDDNCFDCMTAYMFRDLPGWWWANRSPYLENSYYPQGWTVSGLSMGYPLFLTSTTMSAVAPGYNFWRRFSNVRMWALNFGIAGQIIPSLDYKFKFTYTDNYGTYCEEYYSGADFAKKRPNYYFEKSKSEFYTGVWLNWHYKYFTFSAALNYDFGEIYESFSGRLGVAISLNIPAKK